MGIISRLIISSIEIGLVYSFISFTVWSFDVSRWLFSTKLVFVVLCFKSLYNLYKAEKLMKHREKLKKMIERIDAGITKKDNERSE